MSPQVFGLFMAAAEIQAAVDGSESSGKKSSE